MHQNESKSTLAAQVGSVAEAWWANQRPGFHPLRSKVIRKSLPLAFFNWRESKWRSSISVTGDAASQEAPRPSDWFRFTSLLLLLHPLLPSFQVFDLVWICKGTLLKIVLKVKFRRCSLETFFHRWHGRHVWNQLTQSGQISLADGVQRQLSTAFGWIG